MELIHEYDHEYSQQLQLLFAILWVNSFMGPLDKKSTRTQFCKTLDRCLTLSICLCLCPAFSLSLSLSLGLCFCFYVCSNYILHEKQQWQKQCHSPCPTLLHNKLQYRFGLAFKYWQYQRACSTAKYAVFHTQLLHPQNKYSNCFSAPLVRKSFRVNLNCLDSAGPVYNI